MKINIWIVLQILEVTFLALFGIDNANNSSPAVVITFPYALVFTIFLFLLLGINFFLGWMAHRHFSKK